MMMIAVAGLISQFLSAIGPSTPGSQCNVDWPSVGNDRGCMRYSVLDKIDRDNVAQLEPAWTYHTGELEGRAGKTIECTPLVIDGVMYITTRYLCIVALDAATGKEVWQFDPLEGYPFEHQPTSGGVNRDCAYWTDSQPDGQRRIIHGTSDGRLFSPAAKKYERIVQVGNQQRSMEMSQDACRFVREGGLGRIVQVQLPNYPVQWVIMACRHNAFRDVWIGISIVHRTADWHLCCRRARRGFRRSARPNTRTAA